MMLSELIELESLNARERAAVADALELELLRPVPPYKPSEDALEQTAQRKQREHFERQAKNRAAVNW